MDTFTWYVKLVTVPLMVIWGGINILEGRKVGGAITLVGAALLAYTLWSLA